MEEDDTDVWFSASSGFSSRVSSVHGGSSPGSDHHSHGAESKSDESEMEYSGGGSEESYRSSRGRRPRGPLRTPPIHQWKITNWCLVHFSPTEMEKNKCRELIKLALAQRAFPPQLQLPESQADSIATLFTCPYMVWAPESLLPNQRPACIEPWCLCTPSIEEYMCRTVDNVDHTTHFLYVKYCCTGTGADRPVFSTKGGKYLSQASDTVQLQLPYILQEKGGKSIGLFKQIHDGIMSADGLERVRTAVERNRYSRYYFLRSLFAARVSEKQRRGQMQLMPSPVPVEDYMRMNPIPSHQTLTQLWLGETTMLRMLANHVMRGLQIKRVLRIDHSRKLAKKLRKHTASSRQGQREMHLLLLVQNEVGQVVARALTRSENNEEIEHVLVGEIKDRITAIDEDSNDPPVYLVTDNANALRGTVQSVFGSAVCVKQDLFGKALQEAIYDEASELKPPEIVAAAVEAVCKAFVPRDQATTILRCTVSEWDGCIKSNIEQIRAGDLYVPSNVYEEGAGTARVEATSQLESVHAQLKRLINRAVSYEVGLRVLDIYLLEHNLRCGAKFWRNPNIGSLDLLSLCRAAVRCNGILPESPQLEFALSVCATQVQPPRYHYQTKHDYPFSAFDAVFRGVQPNEGELQARLHPQYEYRQDIRRIFLGQSERKRVDQSLFAASLRAFTSSTEDASPLSHYEYELLRQVRSDQVAHGSPLWSRCMLTTTVLFNIAVSSGGNTRFKLRQRSNETLRKHLEHIDARIQSAPSKPLKPLFNFQRSLSMMVMTTNTRVYSRRSCFLVARDGFEAWCS